ncbi:tRNA methyltransferase 10 homolog B isoform X2 [Tachyglossus aculeatus]|nr:tRNA methyltransferase 10 homolog B isoform X2 [Tachyglossus aculeatus]XP_038625733.1 tRNA methyltransferase 10 homolog B isoform X2 [Tachyglossus aculeatus]XP_038625734.1 tRNA methyltransferase 10 homolog B isoform X2 [Tachyglossus aculeatus]
MMESMEDKPVENLQQTESDQPRGQGVSFNHESEETLSEIFKLLQIDVGEESPKASFKTNETRSSKNVLRKQKHWKQIIAAKRSKRKQAKERRRAKHAEDTSVCHQYSKRVLKAMMRERFLAARDSGPRLCVDLSMTKYMSKKELSRLASQIRRLYGSNKKAAKPFWIYLTGFEANSTLYEECLRMNDGFSNYLMDVTEDDYLNLFPLESLVYLTPDSEHVLENIDVNKIYILGGLVDENVQKRLTFQKAQENSIQTARLPIPEYMVRNANAKNYHSEILAINQVFDVLSTYYETQNWPEALKAGVSPRKGYILQDSMDTTPSVR